MHFEYLGKNMTYYLYVCLSFLILTALIALRLLRLPVDISKFSWTNSFTKTLQAIYT